MDRRNRHPRRFQYYEMSTNLNFEYHRQVEIARRLNGIIQQLIPNLSPEQQGIVMQAVERAKAISLNELQQIIGVGQVIWTEGYRPRLLQIIPPEISMGNNNYAVFQGKYWLWMLFFVVISALIVCSNRGLLFSAY